MTRIYTPRCQSEKAMHHRWCFVLIFSIAALAVGCGVFHPPTPTPLPGWRSPVSELFVDESAFPEGWQIGSVRGAVMDPTVNHVAREWEGGEYGLAFQSIWRAYTVADAEEKYDELLASQFQPSRPSPYDIFVPFEPSTEIDFQSQTADEFYLACGWWGTAYCELIARYLNYVTEMRLDREAECDGHISYEMTYAEIETVVRAMDAKFAEVMEEFYPASP